LASELWGSDYPVATSILAYPEGRAALAAAVRGGRLTKSAHRHALQDFGELWSQLTSIGLDEEVARLAGAHAEKHALRGYDAVHLTTALELGDEETVMVTWDAELAAAASDAGLGGAGVS
jgi:uncharacterized protein